MTGAGAAESPRAVPAPDTAGVRRVLVVLASATRRGAETEGLSLAGALPAAGSLSAEVVALVPAATGSEGLPVEVLGVSARSVATLRRLRHRAREADVVLAFGSTTLPACAVALTGSHVPFVYRSIGDPAHWVRGSFHRRRTGLLLRRAAHVVALWDGARTCLVELYGLDPSTVSVIPNGRRVERFCVPSAAERDAARAALRPDPRGPVIAYLGALTAEKRVDRAIEAIAALPSASLVVAGDGPERSGLEALAMRVAPGRVHFTGVVDDPVPVLHAADAVVLTSETEGMPGVVIEALLCGVPVAAPRVGALGELIVDGVTGRLTDDGDARATAAALEEVTHEEFPRGALLRDAVLGRLDLGTVARSWATLLGGLAA